MSSVRIQEKSESYMGTDSRYFETQVTRMSCLKLLEPLI